jgi:hypothetical protein
MLQQLTNVSVDGKSQKGIVQPLHFTRAIDVESSFYQPRELLAAPLAHD